MQKVSESFEEYYQRWRRIEQVCNFPIVSVTHGPSMAGDKLSLHRETSSNSLKSLEEEARERSNSTDDGPGYNTRDSFSQYSEGYGSSDASISSSTLNDGSPRSSITSRRKRYGLSGSNSLEHETSSTSLYNHHQYSTNSLPSALTRGRANTLPPTSSIPRNFTISGRLVSRHDSYNEAVESEKNSIMSSNERDKRRRMSESGSERLKAMVGRREVGHGGGGGGGASGSSGNRRNSIKRQSAVVLSAVHEETDSRTESVVGKRVEPVSMETTATQMRSGLTMISSTSSTV